MAPYFLWCCPCSPFLLSILQPGQAQLPKRSFLGGAKGGEVRIELGEMGGGTGDADYYKDTEENATFRQEFEQRKVKQDEHLDEIEQGVDRLGNIATDMGQELNKQDKLLDEVEAQVCLAAFSASFDALADVPAAPESVSLCLHLCCRTVCRYRLLCK
jgi:hypothetical protein